MQCIPQIFCGNNEKEMCVSLDGDPSCGTAVYILLWFSNGFHFMEEGETAGFEAVSDGRQHAVICHVEPADTYPSPEAFADAKKAEPIFFDPAFMTVEYREIRMDYTHRWVNGVLQKFPYDKLYDSPYMTSAYGSGVLHLTDGEESAVPDFKF